MASIKLPELHPEFLTTEDGKKKVIQLPLAEYQRLAQFLEDLEDIIDLEKTKVEPEETVEIADFWAKVEVGG